MMTFDYIQSDEFVPFEFTVTPQELENMFVEDLNRELREIASETN